MLLAPEDLDSEARFFRNFFGYLDDCRRAAVPPSLFQLMIFLHAADTPLALPLPWEPVGYLASRVVLAAVAFWGRWILGYPGQLSRVLRRAEDALRKREKRDIRKGTRGEAREIVLVQLVGPKEVSLFFSPRI